MLSELAQKRVQLAAQDGERFFDAEQNARVAANAEKYYRAMYYGSAESWNLRDRHMFETLETLLSFHGPDSRAVVWAHNSHVGNAAATEMALRGETNIGNLARERLGDEAYLIGFGTHHGTVAAASNWGEPVEIKTVRPAHADSYERLCHETGVASFFLHLRKPGTEVREELLEPRLERAIGVIYRPETELLSHYFQVRLPLQFDEYIWFDETSAVTPLGRPHAPALPQAHPFALLDE
jgi:protein-L-isoaspartate(D-aspartate) O-methyltransferase